MKTDNQSDATPDPEFTGKFEKGLNFWSDSVTAGNQEDAEATVMQLMNMVVEEQMKNPRPDVQLMEEAEDLESREDWAGAEVLRRKVLAMKESSGNFGTVAAAQMSLSVLLRKAGRLDEAWTYAEAAVATGRGFKKTFVFRTKTLLNQAACALARKDFITALAVANEAVAMVESGKIYDLMRAKTLTMRAKCQLENANLTGAEEDLNAAWELLAPRADTTQLDGVIAAVTNWRTVKNQWQMQVKDRQGR